MGKGKHIHIEPSDVQLGYYDMGWQCTVWKITNKRMCDKLILIEEMLLTDYHLYAFVIDYDEIGAFAVCVESRENLPNLAEIVADCINKILE